MPLVVLHADDLCQRNRFVGIVMCLSTTRHACSAAFGLPEVPCIRLVWPVGLDALDPALSKTIASVPPFAVRYLCIV
jgi:hypothetical protein